MLTQLVRLFAQRSIEVDLPWFIAEELLPPQVWMECDSGWAVSPLSYIFPPFLTFVPLPSQDALLMPTTMPSSPSSRLRAS